MSRAAVTARLREMTRLLAGRGFVRKGVDMSPAAVTARLKTLGALSDMCRWLAAVGARLQPLAMDPESTVTPVDRRARPSRR